MKKRWITTACVLGLGAAGGCAKVERGFEEGTSRLAGEENATSPGGGDSAGAKTSVEVSSHEDGADEPPMHGEVGVEDVMTGPAATGTMTTTDLREVTHGVGGTLPVPSTPLPQATGTEDQVPCGARAGNTCSADEYCAYEPGQLCGAADAQAVCKPRPQSCTREHDPVCGCDGVTYSTACVAASKGVGVLEARECGEKNDCEQIQCLRAVNCVNTCGGEVVQSGCCPCPAGTIDDIECGNTGDAQVCGGFAGETCSDEEYCAYEPGQSCGAADASAVCRPRPKVCTQDYAPVCGCDGKTYSNACMAAEAGQGVLSEGECAK